MAPGWFYSYCTNSKPIHTSLSLITSSQYLEKSEGSKVTAMSQENWWQLSDFKWNRIILNFYGMAKERVEKFSQSRPDSKILWNPAENKVVKIQAGNCLIRRYNINISPGNRDP